MRTRGIEAVNRIMSFKDPGLAEIVIAIVYRRAQSWGTHNCYNKELQREWT
jgi:hypothetical protein